jgi:ribosomal protein L17
VAEKYQNRHGGLLQVRLLAIAEDAAEFLVIEWAGF